MPALQRVLVAFDGSVAANRALGLALGLGLEYGSELVLCSVREGDEEPPAEHDAETIALLHEAGSRARAAGVRASAIVLHGYPADAIVACAQEQRVDAICIGTQGKRGLERMLLGSTAEDVLQTADVPTFVVRHPGDDDLEPPRIPKTMIVERVLVALDESDQTDGALGFALALRARENVALICCSVIETGQLIDNANIYGCDPGPLVREVRETAAKLIDATIARMAPGTSIERIVLEGSPADAILRAAALKRADLIVCGTHGRRGLRRLMAGSVAESLILDGHLPVAVVRNVESRAAAPVATPS
jgi:nucleotide-binding universal stress UspA family protein